MATQTRTTENPPQIDQLYSDIVECVSTTSTHSFPRPKYKQYIKPGRSNCRILIELPNKTYKVPNTNILLKLKLIFGFRRVKYIYWVYKKLLFGDVWTIIKLFTIFQISLPSYCGCFPCPLHCISVTSVHCMYV